jgi:hypothetical protein
MRSFVFLILVSLANLQGVSGAVIVSTFSATPPGYVDDSFQVQLSSGLFGLSSNEWAMGFTVPSGQNYQVTGIRVPLAFQSSTTINFTIASESVTGGPGVSLESIAISGQSSIPAVYEADSVAHSILMGGFTYWLEGAISTSNPNTIVTWNAAANLLSGLALGPVANRNAPFIPNWAVTTNTQAAFEIDGIALPEPSTASLFLLGLAAALCRGIRRRRN